MSPQLGFLGLHLLRLRRIRREGIPWLERRDSIRSLARECSCQPEQRLEERRGFFSLVQNSP
jgi:hypothetical protein